MYKIALEKRLGWETDLALCTAPKFLAGEQTAIASSLLVLFLPLVEVVEESPSLLGVGVCTCARTCMCTVSQVVYTSIFSGSLTGPGVADQVLAEPRASVSFSQLW